MTSSAIIRDTALIFIAAAFLGVAYNSLSPLGIRVQPTKSTAIAPAPQPSGLRNETVAIAIEERNASGNGTLQIPPTQPPTALPLPDSPKIAWAVAKQLVASGKAVLVDAREAQTYAIGHIPGAYSLPMSSMHEKMAEFSARIPKEKTIIVYCSSSVCTISRHVAATLRNRYGYADSRDMPGGYAEWRLAEPHTPPEVSK